MHCSIESEILEAEKSRANVEGGSVLGFNILSKIWKRRDDERSVLMHGAQHRGWIPADW